MGNIKHIFVFKTNIHSHYDKLIITERLERKKEIEEWSIDLQDCDRVLRVVTPSITAEEIIELIKETGYECHELE